MERETIERLAMDQSFGEMDADTTALFEAYLAEHAEAQALAQAMSQACVRTRQAVDRRTQTAPLTHRTASLIGVQRLTWSAPARWAAVILLSLSIGVIAGRWSRPEALPAKTIVVRTQPSRPGEGWRQMLSQSEHGFWGAKAVAMLQPRTEASPEAHAGRRGLWDRYRQFTKESNHE